MSIVLIQMILIPPSVCLLRLDRPPPLPPLPLPPCPEVHLPPQGQRGHRAEAEGPPLPSDVSTAWGRKIRRSDATAQEGRIWQCTGGIGFCNILCSYECPRKGQSLIKAQSLEPLIFQNWFVMYSVSAMAGKMSRILFRPDDFNLQPR